MNTFSDEQINELLLKHKPEDIRKVFNELNINFTVFYSPEDKGYIAYILGEPGYSAFGESRESALRELVEVVKLIEG